MQDPRRAAQQGKKDLLSRKSFSQFGEDLFINEFFKKQKNGKYVDLGAFHPMRMNNTYLLHKKGWSGTNVDLNEISIDMFNLARKNDNNICCLLSDSDNTEKTAYFLNNWHSGNTIILHDKFYIIYIILYFMLYDIFSRITNIILF